MNSSLGKSCRILFLTIIICFTSISFATDSISVDSPELLKGYTLYSDITDMTYPVKVQYGTGIISTLINSNTTCSAGKATNVGNNGEEFYFSNCGYPNVSSPSFEVNSNLLNLWQSGNEDIKSDLPNKMKFGIYNKLFIAMKHSYAYNKGYEIYSKDTTKLGQLNNSYYDTAGVMKKAIPESFLISQSGSYKITSMDYIWQTPEIAPTHYYTTSQYDRFQKFQNTILTIGKKVQSIKNTNTLSKLETALLKVLKDKSQRINNDSYSRLMIVYQMVIEQKQNN